MTSNTLIPVCGAVAALLLAAGPALSHVTLGAAEATIGTTEKLVLQVPHGCAGAATTKLRVRVPDGVIGVKPMPKAGWDLEKIHGPYAQPHQLRGASVTEGVVEIAWSGHLADDEYDEFTLRGFISTDLAPGSMLYVPVVQECEDGSIERWIEVPEPGEDAHDRASPAPGLMLLGGN